LKAHVTGRTATGGLLAAATAAALFAGLTFAPRPAQGADSSFFADGPPPDLFLLYTGDVIGYIDPCG
jgi:hypothetical protein